ncbi:MAG: xanthine dehydrogenase family protein molybdopterin-binding subunit [Desulfarculaceae bacterium]|jgi:CO/xanthine dehydrogenase Mo-binding subunit
MSLGQSPVRVGARERVRGETRFGFDQARPGDLFLACVRAKQAPARISEIDPSPALALAGVVRVFTAKDIPGQNRLGIIPVTKDQEFLAQDTVRHPGQALALVAAKTRQAALAGAGVVKVSLETIPGCFDPEQALSPGAPLVHEQHPYGNLLCERRIIRGDVEASLAASAVVVEAEYTTSRLEHVALEMEGGRAEYQEGRVIIWACTQNPHYDRADLALWLGVEPERIRVVQAETGGGFGGKLDLSVQPFLALAAWHLKQPVCLAYTREESFLATAKRHPFRMRYISGADEHGRLTGMKIDLLSDTGAFASYGLAVNTRAAVHATGPYYVPNLWVHSRMAYTNNTWNGAMRGFGVPQVALAHEGQMDALAQALDMDPWKIRRLNALGPGQATATGQVLQSGVGLVQCLDKIRPIYEKWRRLGSPDPERPQGVGLGAMFYGIGNTGVSNPSSAQLEWTAKGRVVLCTGVAEIGQGSDTVLRQLAAARLGLDPEDIELCRGDTDRTTSAGATSASRQTYISGNAVLAAAGNLEALLLQGAGELLGRRHEDLELRQGQIQVREDSGAVVEVAEVVRHLAAQGKTAKAGGRFDPNFTALDPKTGQGRPYAAYAYGAQCALAEVDSASGLVRVNAVAAAHDVGRAVNKRAVLGQICGGVMMGVGMALMEEYHTRSTLNLDQYHIPTTVDAPKVTPLIVEEPEESGPYGAKGVGEPALIPTAPAVAGAVSQALGRPMRHLPLSLERVMEALSAITGKGKK